MQGCVFTRDINKAILIGDAMETGTVQINSAPARGPDHFPFQVNFPIWKYLSLWGSSLNKKEFFSRHLIVAHCSVT